ncbi:ArsO family NAD(P)H-dependent flavin-containing monooxygenase [Streptomonospora halophila]|uniref:ArsO family NAD(P)H-dependent flavin-containing monooxygenase n=1 Tax=Streptomonospora halophila TaxID=427369 RepID=A0ABP9G8K9_9ACTN
MSTPDDTVVIVGGGQSGLAAAHAVRTAGLRPLVLEAGDRAAGSWPHYYDSLTLFSPARHSAMPGAPFPGDPDRYPHRDEVTAYLERYAAGLDVEIRTGTAVEAVEADGAGFAVRTADGRTLSAAGLVAASGSFANPRLPALPGQDGFTGRLLHAADYRTPAPFSGMRVVVVGGGNSAVQIGYELSGTASVTLASRLPIRFLQQRRGGRDLHDWLVETGFDRLPPEWLVHYVGGTLVMETGDYEQALISGRLDWRPMFTAFDGEAVVWADGHPEPVDAVIFATGYRPALGYLGPLGALGDDGAPLHTGGVSATHPGLAYVGLEFQRSFSSNTLRGVHRDAAHVVAPLAAHVRKAPAAAGL